MQVYALATAHVVWLAGICEEVRLSACLDASLDELQAMLWHHGLVVETLDYLQLALQVLGLAQQRSLLISFRVGLRGVHVSLTVHHLIPFPVDDRSSSHTHLEDIGMVGHQADGHESTKAPAVYTQSVHVHVRLLLQELHTLHLVLHLYLT